MTGPGTYRPDDDPTPPPRPGDWQQQPGDWQQQPAPPRQQGEWQQPGGWPPPQQGGVPGADRPADLGPRFVARLLDFILLGLVTGLLGSLVLAAALLGSDTNPLGAWGLDGRSDYVANAVSSVFNAVVALGYVTFMEAARGQTVGKMLLKLRTQGPAGGAPTVEQAMRRNLFTAIPILGVIPFFGWISGLLSLVAIITIAVTIGRDPATRRGWHDDFAGGTTVVRTG